MGEVSLRKVHMIPVLLVYVPIAMGLFTRGVALQDVMQEFQVDSVKAGTLFSSLIMAAMIFSFIGGYLQKKLGSKTVMNLGCLIFSLSYIFTGIAWSYSSLLVFYTLAGIGYGTFSSSFYALLGKIGKELKGLSLGLGTSIYSMGGFLGPLASGFFIKTYGWRTPHLLWGAASFLLMPLEWLTLEEQNIGQVKKRQAFIRVPNVMLKLKDFKLLPVHVAMFSAGFSFGVLISWAPTLFRTFDCLDVVEAGIAFGAFSLGGVLGAPLLGRLSDIWGRKKIIVFEAFTCGILAFLIYSFVHTYYRLIVLSFLFGFFFHPFYSILVSFAQDLAGFHNIGAATGTTISLNYFGSFLSPVMVGALLTRINLRSAMVICGSLPIFLFGSVILFAYE
jgi:MFS family permease